MDDVCQLTLILPAFNEEAGIARAVAEAAHSLTRLGIDYEILVVDDGSRDGTARAVESLLGDYPRLRLLRHDVNRGYGAALRTGFTSARGQQVAFTDADCQFFLDDLALLLPLLDQHPIAVGYRVGRQDAFLRKVYSRGYNFLARTLVGVRVRDIDCALKVFRRDALASILPETSGFFVNTEMLARARQHGLTIAETGVRHRLRELGDSKVSLGDVPRVLDALLPFWWTQVLFAGPRHTRASAARRMQMALALLLFVATCALFLGRLDHPLLEPDEARYAEIPRQMLAEGRVLTPVLHGEDYWQKPPLLYWLVMLSYQCFGVHDWAARLIPALAGILCVGVTTAWGWRTVGFWAGLTSGAILTLSARYLYLAGMLTMDGLLGAFVLIGLAAGHLAMTEPRWRTCWSLAASAACVLGILTKGPVALVLVVPPLVALAFLDRRARFWSMREMAIYGGIVALGAGPWFLTMMIQAPSAASEFLWLHNIARFFAPVDHEKPAWFFLPSLLVGTLPWSLLFIPAASYLFTRTNAARKRRPAALGAYLLSLTWCVLFFSLSGCKRPGYILPAFPLLSLVLGTFVVQGLPWRAWAASTAFVTGNTGQRWARRLTIASCAAGMICCIVAVNKSLLPWNQGVLLVSALGLVGVLVGSRGNLSRWASSLSCLVTVFLLLMVGQRAILPNYHGLFGLRTQVEITSAYEQDEELPILTYPKRWDSINFYTRRDDVESYARGELEQLIRDLKSHGRAMVFVRREGALQELLEALPAELEFIPLGRRDDYVAVGLVRSR